MSNERKLIITNGEKIVGNIIEKDGVFTFNYDDTWIGSKESFDMSPKIKRTLKIHSGVQVKNFLENLLPEDTIRKRIAEQNKTDDKDIFGLLEITGRDAAGALQVYSEEDFQKLKYKSSDVRTITIGELVTGIKKKGSAINFITSVGLKPSLSGAQDKIACRYDKEKGTISFPTNGGATTHILKPNSIAKDKHHKLLELSALNELVSMRLAKKILNNVPDTHFYESTERDLFIVERYDRIVDDADIKRIHQFDFCQYFGISSSDKYEVSNGGGSIGPYGIKNLLEAIRGVSEESLDAESLIDWIVFNYLIENTDSHLKNISMIFTGSGFKLAPYYDITSVGFYRDGETFLFDNHFAFLIGGISKMNDIGDYHWTLLANELGLAPGIFLEKIKSMSIKISKILNEVYIELKEEIANPKNLKGVEKILKYLGESVKEKSYRCLINTKFKVTRENCSECDKKMVAKIVKVSVLGIGPECLMKIAK